MLRRHGLALGFVLATLSTFVEAQLPVIHEAGWTVRACATSVLEMRAVHQNALDGATYVASDAPGSAGVYRIAANCSVTQMVGFSHVNGVIVDQTSGDLFFADLWGGVIYRLPAGGTTASPWVSGFGGGDHDPYGMAIAPSDYSGPILAPGDALVADMGHNGGPKQIWKWSPTTAQGEVLVLAGGSAFSELTDVAIAHDAIYFVDWKNGTLPGNLWRLNAINTASVVTTQPVLPAVGGVAVDPLDQTLLLRAQEQVLRVDPATGSVIVVATLPPGTNGAGGGGIDVSADGRALAVTNKSANTVYVFERALITSSENAFALPLSAPTVDAQISALNAAPPSFDPATWQPVLRHADQHTPSSFVCGQPGVDPVAESYVSAATWIQGADEVSYDNCSSAWYRFTFSLPPSFEAPRLAGIANVDDQGVLFLNGHRITGAMNQAGCQPTSPSDPCYSLFDSGHDHFDPAGLAILSASTLDRFAVSKASWFRPGENELIFAVCGDASPYEPTGLEFSAAVHWEDATVSYCTAKIDSAGCVPTLTALGQPSLALSTPFLVRANAVQNKKAGILFYGLGSNAAPWNGGWLCVQTPIRRTLLQHSGGFGAGTNCTGALSFDFLGLAHSGLDPQLVAGARVFVQAWYRDPAGSAGSGLSGGLSFTLEP